VSALKIGVHMPRPSYAAVGWFFIVAGLAFLAAYRLQTAEAHAPYRPATPWYGARAIQVNAFTGATRGSPTAHQIAVLDYYGLGAIKSSIYDPDQSWNKSDNLYTWVVKDVSCSPTSECTRVGVWPHDGNPPSATHIHLFSYGEADGIFREDNDLRYGPAYVGDIDLSSGTVQSGTDSAASVISHEIGHAVGLADETTSHDTLMLSPNPGVRQSSSSDRRTANYCIPVFFYYPC
jgi:hypothetical protein